MKLAIAFLLGVLPAIAEHPSCYIIRVPLNGANADVISVQARDQDTPPPAATPVYSILLSADDLTNLVASHQTTLTTSNGTAAYTISATPYGTAGILLKDGGTHKFTASMVTNTMGTIRCDAGFPVSYKYNTTLGADDFQNPLFTASNFTPGANIHTLDLWVNIDSTYSMGVSGSVTCALAGGINVLSDGMAGAYVAKYGINCSQLHAGHFGTAETISVSAAQSAYAAGVALNPMSSTCQFQLLTWAFPFQVTGISSTGAAGTVSNSVMSITGFFANNAVPITSYVVSTLASGALSLIQATYVTPNPYFLSGTATPFTSYGMRPTMAMSFGKCDGANSAVCATGNTIGNWVPDLPSAIAGLNASFASKGTNPVNGQIYYANNGGSQFTRNTQYSITTPIAYGTNTGIAPTALNVTVSAPTQVATVTATGILGYSFAEANPNPASTLTVVAPGVAYMTSTTSFNGNLGVTATSQETPLWWWLLRGAPVSAGPVAEYFGFITFVYPDQSVFFSSYTRCDTAIEALWRATSLNAWGTTFAGDPLTQPFSCPAAPPSASPSVSSGMVCSGCIVASIRIWLFFAGGLLVVCIGVRFKGPGKAGRR